MMERTERLSGVSLTDWLLMATCRVGRWRRWRPRSAGWAVYLSLICGRLFGSTLLSNRRATPCAEAWQLLSCVDQARLGCQASYEIVGFLKAHNVFDYMTLEDLERNVADLKSL